MSQVTKLSFKGQPIYIGIDVHLKRWNITVITNAVELATKSIAPSAQILSHYLKLTFPEATYYSVYEAGYCGYWIHEQLIGEGIKNIIVNAADIPTTDKEKRRKTDKVDSRKLARELKKGDLKSIYIPDKAQQEDKMLLRTRKTIVKKQTSCKNQIKSTLHFFGIFLKDDQIKSHWSRNYLNWLRTLSTGVNSRSLRLKTFLDELEHLRKTILELTRAIRALSQTPRYKDRVKWLSSIPGISTLTAMIILTELGDIKTYSKLNNLCSYVGLIGDEHTSDERERKLPMTRRGNKYLKNILIESSWVAIRKDPSLLLCYTNYTKSNIATKSIVKIARKLLNRIRYVLVNETEYKCQTI